MRQISTVLVQSWRANCDIQLLLYDSDPYNSNLVEFAKVANYIVSYITKGNIGLNRTKNNEGVDSKVSFLKRHSASTN